MRILQNSCLLILLTIFLSSCNWFHREPPICQSYHIALRFQDASGENIADGAAGEELTAGTSLNGTDEGDVNPDSYSLDIVLQNYVNGEAATGPDDRHVQYSSSLKRMKFKEFGTCLTGYIALKPKNNNVRKVTYKLKCPAIFGDKERHEIVTYWDLSDKIYAKCYCIEFEGKEMMLQDSGNPYISLGVITLE